MTDAKPIYGPGKITAAHFANGKPITSPDCDYCDCPEHDYERERPKPEGTYVEVRLDNEGANVGPGRVVLLTEREYDDLRAEAWDKGHRAGAGIGLGIGERIVGTRSDWPAVPKNPYRREARDE